MYISNGLAQGETCATAVPIPALPFSFAAQTCGSGDDYFLDDANPNICNEFLQPNYIDNEDFVFVFTAPENDCYYMEIPAGGGGVNDGTSFHVFESCPDDPLNVVCLGWAFVRESQFVDVAAIENVVLEAGQTVYIVISKRTGCSPGFTFNIEASAASTVENDLCLNAIPLPETGTNTDATNCGEPQDWAPNSYGAICAGSFWSSNENGVWYTIEITDASPDPFSITIQNVACTGGMVNLQMGLWEDVGDCTLSAATFIECSVGLGSVTIGPLSLANGNYHLFIDGQSGSDCTWEFESELLCTVNDPTPDTYGPYCSTDMLPNTLAATPDDPANVLTWYNGDPRNSGVNIGTGTSIPRPSYITNTPGSYEVWVTESVPGEPCETNGVIIMIEVNETPTASISGNGAVCAGSGELVDLNLELTGTGPWDVIYAIDGLDQALITYTNSPQIIQAGEGETITITSVFADDCDGTFTGSVTIGSIPIPTVTLTGFGAVCAGSGDLVDLNLELTGTGPWDVIYAIDGIDQALITYTMSSEIIQAGEGETITITFVSGSGCPGITSGSVTVRTLPIPSAEITGSGEVCEDSGELVELNLILIGNGPWDVIYAIDGVDQAVNTFTSSPQIIEAGEGETISITSVFENGCNGTTIGSVTIGSIPLPIAALVGSGAACVGSGDMVDLILELSGTGPWDVIYDIDGTEFDVSYTTSPQIIQAEAGQTVTLISVFGEDCAGIAIGSQTIGSIPPPTATLTGSGELCAGSNDLIDLNLDLSGAGPWDVIYAINGMDQALITYATSPQIIQAGAGETITITSVNEGGCEGSTTGAVTIETIDAPSASLTASGSICEGSDSTIFLNLSLTGTGPWEVLYSINGMNQPMMNFATSPQMFILREGQIFELISVSALGCNGTVSTDININFPSPPTASIVTPDPICNASINGSVINFDTLIINGDRNGSWADTDGSGASGVLPMLDFDGVAPNSFTFTYTTSSAISPCPEAEYEITIIVEDCNCPSIAIMTPAEICNDFGMLDLPTLEVTAEAGTWSITSDPGLGNPATISGNNLDGVGADPGQYELTFTLNNTPPVGCASAASVTLMINGSPQSAIGSSAIVCGEPGTIINLSDYLTDNPSGGIWTVDSGLMPSTFDAGAGTFDASVDSDGPYVFSYTLPAEAPCTPSVATVRIDVDSPLSAGTGGMFNFCDSGTDLIDLHTLLIDEDLGGTWSVISNNVDLGSFDATNATFNPIGHSATTIDFQYAITGTAVCVPASQIISITITAQARANISSNAIVCNNSPEVTTIDFNSLINSSEVPGTWTDRDGSGATGEFPILNFNGLYAGTYTFIYTLAANFPCDAATFEVDIFVENCDCPSLEITTPPTLCNDNEDFDLDLLQVTNEAGNWSITNFPVGTNPATLSGSTLNAAAADSGQYDLSFTLLNAVPDGCPNSASVTVQVEAAVNAGESNTITICNQINNSLDLNTLLSPDAAMGIWTVSGLPIPSPGSFDPNTGLLNLGEVEPGVYNFDYLVSGTDPCPDDVASFTMNIETCDTTINTIFFPNVFSPNQDGINDLFLPFSMDVAEIAYFVYDRWGSNVFESNNINSGWDGTFKGKLCNVGVYVFCSKVIFLNGETNVFSGDVTLIR